jgi:starch phosphorylase
LFFIALGHHLIGITTDIQVEKGKKMNKYLQYKPHERKIAYFSMEIGIGPELPVYSGGLGVLAGDTLKSFADLKTPVVGVTLLSEKGYFHQEIDDNGRQVEIPVEWDHTRVMTLLDEKITVMIEGRTVMVQAWVYELSGITGFSIPILFLDTNIETNHQTDRSLTSFLYGGDARYRLKQEVILGIGGVRMLQVLDHDNLEVYHMNEGHSALLVLELMDRFGRDLKRVRELCVFTTHTPVPAGHDRFDVELVKSVLTNYCNPDNLRHDHIIDNENRLNMTYLALYHSDYINGVAKKHAETSREMFPQYRIDAITNGIHPTTWASDAMAKVFDRYIPAWRMDPYCLRNALNIPLAEIWTAHMKAKKTLVDFVNTNCNSNLAHDVITIGYARRATPYKRPDLLFSDLDRLISIAEHVGKFQIIYGGKAHPKDEEGKSLIQKIWNLAKDLKDRITLVYIPNYDMYRAKLMISGVDLWLNTPMPPMEASGTSGMKAALNGVINFSVLDGWWAEGHIEDLTGWSIGTRHEKNGNHIDAEAELNDLYTKLEQTIIPKFINDPLGWQKMMAYNIALNGSFFNTQRMVSQYVTAAYIQ